MLEHLNFFNDIEGIWSLFKGGSVALTTIFLLSLFGSVTGFVLSLSLILFCYLPSPSISKKSASKEPKAEDLASALKELEKPNTEAVPNQVTVEEISPFFESDKIHELFTDSTPERADGEHFSLEKQSSSPSTGASLSGEAVANGKPKEGEPGSLTNIRDISTQGDEELEKESLRSLVFSEERAKLLDKFQKFAEFEYKLVNLEETFKDSSTALAEIGRIRKEIGEINRLILQFNQSVLSQKSILSMPELNFSKSKSKSEFAGNLGSLEMIPEESKDNENESISYGSLSEFGESISHRIDGVMNHMQEYFTHLLPNN